MPKLTLNTIGSRYGSIDALNDNFDAIEAAVENTLSLDGTTPNEMQADLSMGDNRIINLARAINNADAVTLEQVNNLISAASSGLIASQVERQTATAAQTLVTISSFTYLPGANNLAVFVNGLRQYSGEAYNELTNSTFQFTEPLNEGDRIEIISNEATANSAVLAENVSYTPAGTGAVATNVQSRLREYEADGGADLIGFLPSGTGATERAVGDKLREFVSVKDFGAVGDGVADDTVAIQAAVDAHKNVHFPVGTYLITSTITCSQFGQCLIGPGNLYAPSTIQYGGTGTAITFTSAAAYVQIRDGIYIKGVPAVGTDYYNTGSVAIDVTAGATSIEMSGCWVSNFETLVKSNYNSFYNKFTNNRFERFRYGLWQFYTNNLHVEGNRFVRFNEAIRGNGTNGPLTISKNAFEIFNGHIYLGTGVERCVIVFDGNYVELYDSIDLPTNFPASAAPNTTKFGGNTLFTGPIGSFTAEGNELQIGGCFRILSSSTAIDYLKSVGNNIHLYTADNNLDRMYACASVVNLEIRDYFGATQGASGGYSRAYSQPAIAQSSTEGVYQFYDCITGADLFPSANVTTLTLLNGWTNPDVNSGTPRAFKKGDFTILRGMIDGTARTDIIAFQLPASARPHEYGTTSSFANFSVFSGSGGGTIVRFRYFYATGDFRMEGSPAAVNNIPLDGIVIPPRH